MVFSFVQTGIKNFIVNLVIQKSSNEEVFRRERVFMTKLNVILVQIVKQEWPVCGEACCLYIVNFHNCAASVGEGS